MTTHQLLHGVEHEGTVHRAFTVRLPVVRDTLEALRATQEALGTTEGAAAGLYYRVAVIAQALTSLGDLPGEAITPDLLADGLTDEDFDLIDAEIAALKKKRIAPPPSPTATA